MPPTVPDRSRPTFARERRRGFLLHARWNRLWTVVALIFIPVIAVIVFVVIITLALLA